jgi:hypothetical protein
MLNAKKDGVRRSNERKKKLRVIHEVGMKKCLIDVGSKMLEKAQSGRLL